MENGEWKMEKIEKEFSILNFQLSIYFFPLLTNGEKRFYAKN
jgi:hypothetical protein